MNTIQKLRKENLRTDRPEFGIGDTVRVDVVIVEGDKERVQAFTGTVISRRGTGITQAFTVRRVERGFGVERVFPLHSPRVAGLAVVKRGKVRRAKLYYLRGLIGKASRIAEAGNE